MRISGDCNQFYGRFWQYDPIAVSGFWDAECEKSAAAICHHIAGFQFSKSMLIERLYTYILLCRHSFYRDQPTHTHNSMANKSKGSSILPTDRPPRAEDDVFKGSAAMTKTGAYAAFAYMACAVLLVMFNKAALSSYSFPCANVITLCQMICSCCFLYVMRWLKIISFSTTEPVAYTDSSKMLVPMKTLINTSPLALTYLIYMLTSMESIREVNVPMYTTLRRTTVVFTMIFEYILVKQKYTRHILGSVALIVFGAFIAGARDLSFDAYGYLVVIVCNIATAVYLTTIARIGKSSGLNSFGLMWCNGVLCGPILLLWTFSRGDLETTKNFPYLLSPGFMGVMFLSCIMAFFLNYTIFLNTALNSALTQAVCGNLKDVFTILIGWVAFGGPQFDLMNVGGQFVGFMGSAMYAYYKLRGK